MSSLTVYRRRVVDDELDELIGELAAIAIEGPKGVGKTRTALGRARTVHRLDDAAELYVARGDPARLLDGESPDRRMAATAAVWDLVRRAVDDGAPPGSFLLTGSAVPDPPPTHSGAGRIVSLRLRPLALAERLDGATVSLAELLSGARPNITGATDVALGEYTELILASGLPGVAGLSGRARRLQLTGYIERIVDRDVRDDAGVVIRNPAALRRWLAAYAAASSTSASFEERCVTPPAPGTSTSRRGPLPTPTVTRSRGCGCWTRCRRGYRPATRCQSSGRRPSISLPTPGWPLSCSARAPTRCWPAAAAARRSRATARCSAPCSRAWPRSRCASTPRTTRRGWGTCAPRAAGHEIDLIVERADGAVVAVEVKLARDVAPDDLRHLAWLSERLGDRVLDQVILTTGPAAYRRPTASPSCRSRCSGPDPPLGAWVANRPEPGSGVSGRPNHKRRSPAGPENGFRACACSRRAADPGC